MLYTVFGQNATWEMTALLLLLIFFSRTTPSRPTTSSVCNLSFTKTQRASSSLFNRERDYDRGRVCIGREPQDQQHIGASVLACQRSRRRRRIGHGCCTRSQPRSHRAHPLAERTLRTGYRCTWEHAQEEHNPPESFTHTFVFNNRKGFSMFDKHSPVKTQRTTEQQRVQQHSVRDFL